MTETKNKNILVIAGEVSGDLIGASLIKELKKTDPALMFYGIGGDKMLSEGMEVSYHINQMAFLGFVEVIKHLPFIKKAQRKLVELVKSKNIKNVVLIDYPGFNLSIAKKLKALGVKIIYYVSPQLWAWGLGRMKKVIKLVDKMLVVFPFEEKMYKDNNVNVQFVGHPLVERINNHEFLLYEDLCAKFKLVKEKGILLIMPGSRENEVNKIFPQTIKAASRIASEFDMQIVVSCSSNLSEKLFSSYADEIDFKLIKGFTYDLMKHAKFGIIKSGTSTLEAGYFALPMLIVYKTNYLTYLVVKKLIKVDSIGMVNILLEEKIIPELIQNRLTENLVYEESKKILSNSSVYEKIKTKLSEVKNKLAGETASISAAKSIYKIINES
ncbi:MAG: lipid-A-disaccharide synthase [Ignavibacteriae bacterium]|nr:MAG: lipid-A-disaccharide synthase [Ignavibacteriota bacterium]